jgi:hypothetical protein
MAIKGAEYAVTRMTATLQTYLPAELDLIEAEMADAVTLDDVPNGAYLEYEADAALVEHALAITVNVIDTEPIEIKSTTNNPGVAHADHNITVGFHLKDTYNEEPHVTKRRVLRYARAIERVLAIKYPTAPSGGAETVIRIRREEAMTYRLNEEQAEGQSVRSAAIPFIVTTYEQL